MTSPDVGSEDMFMIVKDRESDAIALLVKYFDILHRTQAGRVNVILRSCLLSHNTGRDAPEAHDPDLSWFSAA